MHDARSYDVVVWGATGFTGQLVAEHLARRQRDGASFRWAIAGRSASKLRAVRDMLDLPELDIIVADSMDAASLDAMCAQTKVVLSTVGPYAQYGSPLIEACIRNATDYCDLCGEVPWMREMLDQHADAAKASGARLVHCCGFDSIPSDLGVWFLQQQARQQFGQPATRIRCRVRRLKGTASGGTVASMLGIIEAASENPDVARILANPYALNPEGQRKGPRQDYVAAPRHEAEFDAWAAPFVMAAINSRVVQRSHALRNENAEPVLLYDEAMLTGDGFGGRMRAYAISAGLLAFAGGAKFSGTRNLMSRFLLPEPGEGPTPEQQEAGGFELWLRGETASGEAAEVRVTGNRDPGYGATSRMIGEAALSLGKDDVVEAFSAGFLTPSTALGESLLARLRQHAGMQFEVM